MSNTIYVKGYDYRPFRWVGSQLQAFIGGTWKNVTRTAKKNVYKDYVFIVGA